MAPPPLSPSGDVLRKSGSRSLASLPPPVKLLRPETPPMAFQEIYFKARHRISAVQAQLRQGGINVRLAGDVMKEPYQETLEDQAMNLWLHGAMHNVPSKAEDDRLTAKEAAKEQQKEVRRGSMPVNRLHSKGLEAQSRKIAPRRTISASRHGLQRILDD
eukprot:TRINITY_DN20841_c0_g1_i1.p1 TRINITY_DN20841_c0_g1~~TRINITY_DN20841_c0_g1_i1.p1  ORF type:complete len:160 (-),score=44.20 TRINITY_DN20841_c0_g1_i1:118-597(-)